MNSGIIASRYAKAFFLLTQERGSTKKVFSEVRELLKNGSLSTELSEDLLRFVELVKDEDRLEYLSSILKLYLDFCLDAWGMKSVLLTSAIPAPELQEQLRKVLQASLGCELIFETRTDPSLIGGFIVEVGGYELDASVRTQIDSIRAEFIIQNNRLV